jgi:glycosyltransferase involved in cell wall biosynthesis
MSCQCAVIATATGGIPELLRDGIEGLLVPPNDAPALTACLRRCAEDPAFRGRLGVAGRARVLERFTLGESIGHHLDWIEAAAR